MKRLPLPKPESRSYALLQALIAGPGTFYQIAKRAGFDIEATGMEQRLRLILTNGIQAHGRLDGIMHELKDASNDAFVGIKTPTQGPSSRAALRRHGGRHAGAGLASPDNDGWSLRIKGNTKCLETNFDPLEASQFIYFCLYLHYIFFTIIGSHVQDNIIDLCHSTVRNFDNNKVSRTRDRILFDLVPLDDELMPYKALQGQGRQNRIVLFKFPIPITKLFELSIINFRNGIFNIFNKFFCNRKKCFDIGYVGLQCLFSYGPPTKGVLQEYHRHTYENCNHRSNCLYPCRQVLICKCRIKRHRHLISKIKFQNTNTAQARSGSQ